MRSSFIIVSTFFFAYLLTVLPMPEWAIWIRPAWVLLVLLYWNMMLPTQIGVTIAWILGLGLDELTGSLLGEHALALVIVSYVMLKMHTRVRMFPLIQQALSILLLVLLYQFIIYCSQGFLNDTARSHYFWLSSVVSMCLWPWIAGILKNVYVRFRMASSV